MKSGQLSCRLLVSKWSTRPVISLRPVRRLLMVSGPFAGRWLVSVGSSRPVVRLRLVRRPLRLAGGLVCCGCWSVNLGQLSGLGR